MVKDQEGDRPRPPVARRPESPAAKFNDRLTPQQLHAEMERLAQSIGQARARFDELEDTLRAIGINGGERMRKLSDAIRGCRSLVALVGYPVPEDADAG